jgi:ATP-dependent Lon protease
MSEEQNPALEGEIVDNGENSREIGKLNLPAQTLPTTVHILPMTEKPFFPAQTLPLVMNEGPWMETVKQIGESGHHLVGLVAVRGDVSDDARPEDFYSVGTLVRMHHPMHSDGKIQFIAEGVTRFKVAEWVSGKPPFVARVEYPSQPRQNSTSEEVKAYALAIINAIKDLLPLNPLYSEELKFFLNRFSPNEPALLTDFAASLTTAPKEKLQEVIEAFNLRKRMQKVLVLIKKELEVAKLQTQIREKVEEKMTQQQREFFLREQLRAIQKELGIAKDDRTADIDLYRERLEKLTLPAHAQKKIDEEMNKLSGLEHGSPEYTVTRNYLDWLSSLPWGKFTKDKRPRRGQGPHPRVPRRAQAQGPATRHRSCASGRPARRRQDQPRPQHRARDGAQVLPLLARRHARRGRDQGPPPHLHRRPARPHPAGPQGLRQRTTR